MQRSSHESGFDIANMVDSRAFRDQCCALGPVLARLKYRIQRPPRGWVKAIREALGMTTRQLASRIGVGQSRVVDIEKGEMTGSITLDSLQRAARAQVTALTGNLAEQSGSGLWEDE